MKIIETPDIVVVSNDESFHAFLKFHFDDCYHLHCFESEKEAFQQTEKLQPAIIISSSKIGGKFSGVDVLSKSKSISPLSKRILMSDDLTSADMEKVVNEAQVFRVLSLPFDVEKITRVLDEAILAYAERMEREKEMERLTTLSQQLEFQLRQSLIS